MSVREIVVRLLIDDDAPPNKNIIFEGNASAKELVLLITCAAHTAADRMSSTSDFNKQVVGSLYAIEFSAGALLQIIDALIERHTGHQLH